MITFNFNGLDFSNDIRVNEIKGRGLTPSEVSTIAVPGMAGAHVGRKTRKMREIEITFTVVGSTLTDLRNKINTLSERLDLDEVAPLVFSDEPDKTYYAIMQNASDDDEIKTYGFGTFTFLCPDPYKYGPEMTAALNGDTGTIVNVNGTAPTSPIFELDATGPSTFAMVANDKGEYNMVGQADAVEEEKYAPVTNVLNHGMQNATNWVQPSIGEIDGTIAGTMSSIYDSTDGLYKFKANGFGTETYGKVWHGPALKRSLPEPLQNFRAESRVKLHNRTANNQLGNIEMYLLDVNGQIVARIGLRDSTASYQSVQAQARIGTATGTEGVDRKTLMNTTGATQGTFNDFDGVIRISRNENVWEAYVAKIDSKGRHHTRLFERWVDTRNRFTNPVTQVVLAMQTYSMYTGAHMAFLSVKVDKLMARPTPTAISYVTAAGDTVTFDHNGKGRYFINGQDAKNFKNFGATSFKLEPGANTIVVQPEGSFTGTVRWRPAYK